MASPPQVGGGAARRGAGPSAWGAPGCANIAFGAGERSPACRTEPASVIPDAGDPARSPSAEFRIAWNCANYEFVATERNAALEPRLQVPLRAFRDGIVLLLRNAQQQIHIPTPIIRFMRPGEGMGQVEPDLDAAMSGAAPRIGTARQIST
jgi:hypothetical protein